MFESLRKKKYAKSECARIGVFTLLALGCFKGSKISYYSNSTATFRTRLLLLFDTEVNPGPDQLLTSQRKLKCLYLNSRSLVNKAKYLEAMESSNEHDLIAVTETWLNPSVRDSELLINIHFNVHCRDRESGEHGGGVMLAVRHHFNSTRRSDLETDVELLACEIIPNDRKKFLCLVFYRPPSSGINTLKALKQCLRKANRAHFTQFLVMGDFNMPDINWLTMAPTQNL